VGASLFMTTSSLERAVLSFVITVHTLSNQIKSSALSLWQTGTVPDAATTASVTGARARARAEVRAAILAAAAERVARDGATDLSLRAVARDVGMVSSAVYRYFASRDDLLTALIIQAYDSLGDRVDAHVATTSGRPAAERWVDVAMEIRRWAHEHPNDYALRVELDLGVDDATLLAIITAWTQLFGLLTFELFGQTHGFVSDDEALFRAAAAAMATWIGLPRTN